MSLTKFRKEYPEASKLFDKLGFLDLKERGGMWTVADGLVQVCPVLYRVGVRGINDAIFDEWQADACKKLQDAIDDRESRGTPADRCRAISGLARAHPDATVVVTPGFDSIEWRLNRFGEKLSVTFRSYDWKCIHELAGRKRETLLAQVETWPAKLES